MLCFEKRRQAERMRTARGRLGDKRGKISDKAPVAFKVETRETSRCFEAALSASADAASIGSLWKRRRDKVLKDGG